MKKVLAIYHKDCIDGTTAAAVVLRKYAQAQLFPLGHSHTEEDLRKVLATADVDTDIYTVDCAIGVVDLLEQDYKVTTLDHHISEKENLEALAEKTSNFRYVFDNDKSGASLAWSFFFPQETEPELIKYVEDSDLWKGKYGEETKYVNNYLSMFRNDPKRMLEILEGDLETVKAKGEVIAQYADMEIQNQVQIDHVNLQIGKYIAPAYNIGVYQSAIGNVLSEKLDRAVALFTIKGSEVTFSFRSKGHQSPSALELAEALGGGGHQNAAGARLPLADFLQRLL